MNIVLHKMPKQKQLYFLTTLFLLFTTIINGQTKSNSAKQIKTAQKVLLGNWAGSIGTKKVSIKIANVVENRVTGFLFIEGQKHSLKGTYANDVSDQPCSRAFITSFTEICPDGTARLLIIHFVGYEALRESDFGLECAGNLNGSEASGYWKGSDRLPNQCFTLTKKD